VYAGGGSPTRGEAGAYAIPGNRLQSVALAEEFGFGRRVVLRFVVDLTGEPIRVH